MFYYKPGRKNIVQTQTPIKNVEILFATQGWLKSLSVLFNNARVVFATCSAQKHGISFSLILIRNRYLIFTTFIHVSQQKHTETISSTFRVNAGHL